MCVPLSSILQFIKYLLCLSLANKVQHNLASCQPCCQLLFFHLCTTSHPNPDCSSNMPLGVSIYRSLFLEEKSQISAQFSSLLSSLSLKVNRSKRPSLTTFFNIGMHIVPFPFQHFPLYSSPPKTLFIFCLFTDNHFLLEYELHKIRDFVCFVHCWVRNSEALSVY